MWHYFVLLLEFNFLFRSIINIHTTKDKTLVSLNCKITVQMAYAIKYLEM